MLSTVLFAQNEAKQLTPKWKKGVVTEYIGSYSYMGNDASSNDVRMQVRFNADFEVVQDEKDQYIIRSLVPNLVILEALDLANNGKADFTAFREVNIFYSYNKTTGSTELLNWENLQQIYQESKSEMSKFVKYYPQKQMKLEAKIRTLDHHFKNQETIATVYKDQMSWFISHFGKNLVLNKPFTASTKLTNPFFNNQTIKGSVVSEVNKIDTKTNEFTYTKDFNIKDSYYKNVFVEYLKQKQSKKEMSEREKEKLKDIGLVTFHPDFMEYGTINYETTLPVSLKLDYKLDEKTGPTGVKTYKKLITLNEKK